MKSVLKHEPFGYKSTKELFEKLITPCFYQLNNCMIINCYYNFIFATGALKDQLKNEEPDSYGDESSWFWSNKYCSIFHTIYNNAKHYILTESKTIQYKLYVIKDGTSSSNKTNSKNDVLWDDNQIWDDEAYWIENIKGDPGGSSFFVTIQNNTGEKETYFLYEICKQVYCFYKDLF